MENKQIKKMKLIDYRRFCQFKDFKDFKKGILPQDRLYVVKEPEKLDLIKPINLSIEKEFPNTCTSKEFYLVSINNALCLKNQTIIYKDKFILPDSFRHYCFIPPHKSLQYDGASNSFHTKEKISKVNWIPGDSIFLSGENSQGYGHFLLEVVSRLWITQFIDVRKYKFIMNPNDTNRWQFDLLRALGIRPKQIIFLHHPIRCERLHIPVQAFVLRKYTSTFAYETWKRIGDFYDTGVGPDKIYVSRRKLQSKRRQLLNEKEVEKVFSSHGFSIIHPQELSVSKQITLFRNANIIAGPSGSAMYNSVFQKKHTKKLILTTRNFLKISDVLINTSTKGQLNYLIGETVDDGTPVQRANWLIDIDKLKKFLNNSL